MDKVELPHLVELDRCMKEVHQNMLNEDKNFKKRFNEDHHLSKRQIEAIRNAELENYRRPEPHQRHKTRRRIARHNREANRHIMAAKDIVDFGGSKKTHAVHMAYAKLHRKIAKAIEAHGKNAHSKRALAMSYKMLGADRGDN